MTNKTGQMSVRSFVENRDFCIPHLHSTLTGVLIYRYVELYFDGSGPTMIYSILSLFVILKLLPVSVRAA